MAYDDSGNRIWHCPLMASFAWGEKSDPHGIPLQGGKGFRFPDRFLSVLVWVYQPHFWYLGLPGSVKTHQGPL